MQVIKRNGSIEEFNIQKIIDAVSNAFKSLDIEFSDMTVALLHTCFDNLEGDTIGIEEIQDKVEAVLWKNGYKTVSKAYSIYRYQHQQARFIKDRINYMMSYANSSDNAASSSETDANANVSMKNVANLEGEVYKSNNRIIQRQMMKDKLNILYPEVAKQYEKDLNSHIIYTHDEASTPVLKPYCKAISLYPTMAEGVGNIDGVTPYAPNDLQSFSGQVTNLAFLISAQCKGAVALGEYLVALSYYVAQEYGSKWYEKLDVVVSNEHCLQQKTIKREVRKAMKQFIFGVCQPAGNRSYNSPY